MVEQWPLDSIGWPGFEILEARIPGGSKSHIKSVGTISGQVVLVFKLIEHKQSGKIAY